MDVSVRGHHLNVSDPLKAYAERRLLFSIGSFEPRIGSIEVRVADVNGPRGGVDKTCAISVVLRRIGPVFARARDSNAYSAIDRAAARMRAVLVRRMRRRSASRRWDARQLV